MAMSGVSDSLPLRLGARGVGDGESQSLARFVLRLKSHKKKSCLVCSQHCPFSLLPHRAGSSLLCALGLVWHKQCGSCSFVPESSVPPMDPGPTFLVLLCTFTLRPTTDRHFTLAVSSPALLVPCPIQSGHLPGMRSQFNLNCQFGFD